MIREARMAGTRPKTNAVATDSSDGKAKDAQIQAALRVMRDIVVGRQANQRGDGDSADDDAERGAAGGNQRAFDEQLSHEAAAAGAERRAKGEVVFAAGQPREHQVGDVRAGDEQNEGDRAHQNRKRRPHVAGQHPREWNGGHRIGRVVSRKLPEQLRLHGFDVLNGGLQRHAGLGAGDRLQMLAAAAGERLRAVVSDQRPHVRAPIEPLGYERLERRRHHANDGELEIVHRDDPPDRGRVAVEAAAPQPVAQDDDAPAVRRVFVGAEVAADRRPHAEGVEKIRRDAHAADPLRAAVGQQTSDSRSG